MCVCIYLFIYLYIYLFIYLLFIPFFPFTITTYNYVIICHLPVDSLEPLYVSICAVLWGTMFAWYVLPLRSALNLWSVLNFWRAFPLRYVEYHICVACDSQFGRQGARILSISIYIYLHLFTIYITRFPFKEKLFSRSLYPAGSATCHVTRTSASARRAAQQYPSKSKCPDGAQDVSHTRTLLEVHLNAQTVEGNHQLLRQISSLGPLGPLGALNCKNHSPLNCLKIMSGCANHPIPKYSIHGPKIITVLHATPLPPLPAKGQDQQQAAPDQAPPSHGKWLAQLPTRKAPVMGGSTEDFVAKSTRKVVTAWALLGVTGSGFWMGCRGVGVWWGLWVFS